MRTVSACAWARVQSRLSAAVAAAELLSSVRREIGIGSSHRRLFFAGKYSKEARESQHGAMARGLAKGLGGTGYGRSAAVQRSAPRSFCAISSSAGFCLTIRLARLRLLMAEAAMRPRAESGMKLSKIASSFLQNCRL